MTSWSEHNNDFTWKLLDELKAVADECKVSQCAVALRWNLQSEGITCPIIGVKKPYHLEQATETIKFELTKEQMDRLNKASTPQGVPYPYQFPKKQ